MDTEATKKERLVELLKLAKGENRTFATYAREAGISQAAITRIVNGDYVPSPKTIMKLTSEAAKPQGGVTYEEMMKAIGYSLQEYPVLVVKNEDVSEKTNDADNDIIISGDAKRRDDIRQRRQDFEKKGISLIYTTLIEKEILFKKNNEQNVSYKDSPYSFWHPDLALELIEQPISEWLFEFRYLPFDRISRMDAYLALGRTMLINLKDTSKLTYVTNNVNLFQFLKRFDHSVSYRGEISVALIDIENMVITEECYLANYHEGDRGREIFL